MRHILKHLPYLLLCALMIALGITIAVVTHRDAVRQQNALDARNAAVAAQNEAHARQQAQEAAQKTQNEMNALRQQCDDGLAAYNLLTSAQVKLNHIVKPDCSL